MRTLVLFLICLGSCAAMFFLVPYHVDVHRSTAGAQTLNELYWAFCRGFPRSDITRVLFFGSLAMIGLWSCFYPAALVVLARWSPNPSWYILGGLLTALGGLVNLTAMLVSQAGFDWGSSAPAQREPMTIFLWILPALQAAAAILSIALGVSAPWADRVNCWLRACPIVRANVSAVAAQSIVRLTH